MCSDLNGTLNWGLSDTMFRLSGWKGGRVVNGSRL